MKSVNANLQYFQNAHMARKQQDRLATNFTLLPNSILKVMREYFSVVESYYSVVNIIELLFELFICF